MRGNIQLWTMFVLMTERMWSRRYREEREHPEWFDLGGES